MNKTKLLILLTVFVDVIGFGIVIPVLPYYVQTFTTSSLVITSLFAVFAFCSFLSAPILGALSDRYGRRPLLITSISSTALGWAIFALAPSLPFLYLGRIIDGLAAGNFSIAQSFLSDISSTPKERTANFGLMGAIFGIGFVVGPLLGGLLGSIGHTVPYWFVAILATINAICAYFFLPETHFNRTTTKISMHPFAPLIRAAKQKQLRIQYIAWFLFGLAIACNQSVFALYVTRMFGFSPFLTGLCFMGVGIIIAINQGVMMKRIWLKYFKEPDLELFMLLGFIVGFLLLVVGPLWVFLIGIFFTTFGQSVLRVVMVSQITGQADPTMRGEALGVTTSLVSLSMAIAPLVSGVVFDTSPRLPFLLATVCLVFAFILLYQRRKVLSTVVMAEEVGETLI